jgi:hypothetical protein
MKDADRKPTPVSLQLGHLGCCRSGLIEKFGQSWLNGSRGLERLEIHSLSFWETTTSERYLLELLPRAEARMIVQPRSGRV